MNLSSNLQMIIIQFLVFLLMGVTSCEEDKEILLVQDQDQPQDTTALPAVESNPPNTSYPPAFPSQTRAPGMKTQTQFTIANFAQGLASPWGIALLPDGRFILTEKNGVLRIVDRSGGVSSPISGLPVVNSFGQGGLLDIAVDPDFNNNRMLYWTYSANINNATATRVAKGSLSADETRVENVQIIYTALPAFDGTAHYGSRLVWDENGNLFVSTGERSNASIRDKAQDLGAALGKVLHITTNGQAVAGNPFIGQSGALDEIYSYGHRNPQGMDRHPVTGELWVIEHGPRGGDEVNLVKPGYNYGWPVISYGIEYGGAPIGAGITKKAGMEQPNYYWDPSIAPCGASFYSGSMIAEWRNNLFVTTLAGQHLVRLAISGDRIIGEERLLEGVSRFRDVIEGADGALYVMEGGNNATIYRLGL